MRETASNIALAERREPQAAEAAEAQAPGAVAPVFIIGCYRSGTTLMENVLARHSAFATLGFETHFFTHVLRGKRLPAFNRDHWSEPLRRWLGVDEWEQVGGDRVEAYRRLMARAAGSNARRWVEKTPEHLFDVNRIRRLFPGAKFICMLRDGRDAVASILHAAYILPRITHRRRRLIAACALWEWMTVESLRLASRGHADVLLLRYESLVASPEQQLARVAQFLGVDDSAAAIAQWIGRLSDVEANSSFGQFSGIDAAPARRWKKENRLTAEENRLVATLIGRTLRSAGYEADSASPPAPLGARMMRAIWLMARLARSTAMHGNALAGIANCLTLTCGRASPGAANPQAVTSA